METRGGVEVGGEISADISEGKTQAQICCLSADVFLPDGERVRVCVCARGGGVPPGQRS